VRWAVACVGPSKTLVEETHAEYGLISFSMNSAADNGHLEVVKLLLEKVADITVANHNGWTPLNSAADSGHLEVVKLLVEKGADITVANHNGWTPLNSAADSGHLEVVKLLVEKGADVNTQGGEYGNALQAASY
jgi:ankyrin repeat protein